MGFNNRTLIFVCISGLVIGFVSVLVHEPRGMDAGFLIFAIGLFALVEGNR